MKVEVPKPEQDKPELGRVGVIAALGFAVGIAWPWLAGVRLVPSPPVDELSDPGASGSASGAPVAASALPAPAAAAATAARTTEETVKIGDLQVTGCSDGKAKKKECDRVGFDGLARGRLAALAACEPAKGARETLSVGFDLDFDKNAVTDVFAGKSTTFSKEKTRALLECAENEFRTVRLDGIEHELSRYTVFYFVEFLPPGTAVADKAAPTADDTEEANGLATVSWDVAVVREQPEEGKIVTRLRYGTRVAVTARRGKWYEVKYDARGAKGWVHKNALGL